MARKRTSAPAGRDTYHVVGLPGVEIVKGEAAHALNVGQRTAEVFKPKGPLTLTIDRRSLFGPTTLLYRIDRTERGLVFTTALDAQD